MIICCLNGFFLNIILFFFIIKKRIGESLMKKRIIKWIGIILLSIVLLIILDIGYRKIYFPQKVDTILLKIKVQNDYNPDTGYVEEEKTMILEKEKPVFISEDLSVQWNQVRKNQSNYWITLQFSKEIKIIYDLQWIELPEEVKEKDFIWKSEYTIRIPEKENKNIYISIEGIKKKK